MVYGITYVYQIDYIVNGLALTIPPGEVVMQEFPYTVQVEGTGFSDKGQIFVFKQHTKLNYVLTFLIAD